LSDSVVTSGQFVRIENQQPCFEYEAWVYFRAYVRTPDVEIEKQVSVDGADWAEEVMADGGDEAKYLLTVHNTSQATLKSVVVKDSLPENQTYVTGSSMLFNNANPNGKSVGDGVVTANGLNIGDIGPGQVAYVAFRVNVADEAELECGLNKMVNTAHVTAGTKSDSDTATVKADKICEQETPEYDCELLATIIDMSARKVSAELTASHSDDVTVTGYNINFGDGTSVDESSATHVYDNDGTFNIVGKVTFDVNGDSKTATCKDKVTIKVDQPVCKYDSTLPADHPNCKPAEKCEVTGKTNLDKDDPKCKPEILPNTGPGSFLTALFGTGTITASFRYWTESRRALKSSLLS
jgi:uncharacterized repeat protein (TIGR01451 family)